MKYIQPLLIALGLTSTAFTQTPTTRPVPLVVNPSIASEAPDPLLGKLFRSRIEGIELNPPGGGTMIRELQGGELVRFVYTESRWDLRVKPIVIYKQTPLSSKKGDGGVLEMMAAQLTRDNPTATIVSQRVMTPGPNSADDRRYGLIEARYNAGTDVIFAQEAIIEDVRALGMHYFAIQMSSPGKPKDAAANVVDAKETEARKMFQHVIGSVRVLDRSQLRDEQDKRLNETHMLWVQIDRKKLESTVQPEHFMRVVHDGQDIGFVQVDERIANHNGNDGLEYIIHSRVETGLDQAIDAARSQPMAAKPTPVSASDSTAIVVPSNSLKPITTPAATKPKNLYTESTYFVSFNRKHEDWVTTTQTDQVLESQLTEMGNSDFVDKMVLDPEKMKQDMNVKPVPGLKHDKSQMKPVADGSLDVSQYTHNRPLGKPINVELPPYYLPQALGQLLPRLLPNDTGITNPGTYLFATYVGNQKNLMARYVDVGKLQDAVLDGKPVQAIPISDRIGVDGISTIHYVTREGKWLGSVNDDSKLVVLPADQKQLADIWRTDPRGFKVCAVAPLAPDQTPATKTEKADHPANSVAPHDVMPHGDSGR